MASRMERYQQHEQRSTRNAQLYKNIENLENYSNIEGVIAIDKTNEIDITRVKELLRDREGYQQEKQYRQLVEEPKKEEPPVDEDDSDERTYDIRDVLVKAKETRPAENNSYRTLKNTDYDISQHVKVRTTKEQEETLRELIDTISLKKTTQTIAKIEDDGGLLDDLKSNTMVGDATSIKKIIEEARIETEKKDQEKKLDETTNLGNIDKTFYTSSMGFTDKDFEELKDSDEEEKPKKWIKVAIVLGIVVVVAVIAVILYFVFK